MSFRSIIIIIYYLLHIITLTFGRNQTSCWSVPTAPELCDYPRIKKKIYLLLCQFLIIMVTVKPHVNIVCLAPSSAFKSQMGSIAT